MLHECPLQDKWRYNLMIIIPQSTITLLFYLVTIGFIVALFLTRKKGKRIQKRISVAVSFLYLLLCIYEVIFLF